MKTLEESIAYLNTKEAQDLMSIIEICFNSVDDIIENQDEYERICAKLEKMQTLAKDRVIMLAMFEGYYQ